VRKHGRVVRNAQGPENDPDNLSGVSTGAGVAKRTGVSTGEGVAKRRQASPSEACVRLLKRLPPTPT
jgi:hypothetical protein